MHYETCRNFVVSCECVKVIWLNIDCSLVIIEELFYQVDRYFNFVKNQYEGGTVLVLFPVDVLLLFPEVVVAPWPEWSFLRSSCDALASLLALMLACISYSSK